MEIKRDPRCPRCRGVNRPQEMSCWRCGWHHPEPSAAEMGKYRIGSHSAARCNMRAHPTSCQYCGASIYYMSCDCGCGFYVNELGDPWPKHACLTAPDGVTCSFSYVQDEVPLPLELKGVFEIMAFEIITASELEEIAPSYIRNSAKIVRKHLGEQFCQIKVVDSVGAIYLLGLPVAKALELRPQAGQQVRVSARCEMLHNFAIYEVQQWEHT